MRDARASTCAHAQKIDVQICAHKLRTSHKKHRSHHGSHGIRGHRGRGLQGTPLILLRRQAEPRWLGLKLHNAQTEHPREQPHAHREAGDGGRTPQGAGDRGAMGVLTPARRTENDSLPLQSIARRRQHARMHRSENGPAGRNAVAGTNAAASHSALQHSSRVMHGCNNTLLNALAPASSSAQSASVDVD